LTLWRMVLEGRIPPPVRITERNASHVLATAEACIQAQAQGLIWERLRGEVRKPSEGTVRAR
jgi:hypothetical protein